MAGFRGGEDERSSTTGVFRKHVISPVPLRTSASSAVDSLAWITSMKYEAKIDGRQVAITIEERDGTVSATVDDRLYDVRVVQPEPGVYVIFSGDDVYEARVSAGDQGRLQVKLRGRTFDVNIIDRKHRRPATEHAAEGRQHLTSPMPGKVVRVLLTAGNEVEAGQGVVVVEAMKMQNEIKSPKAGRVVELRVNEGDTVSANQLLAVVE